MPAAMSRFGPSAALILLFLAIATLCTFCIGVYGYSFSDVGFLSGLAWRVFNGEVPYLDFDYVRPPLTPVLQGLVMQLSGAQHYILVGHFQYYLQMLLLSYWTVAIFARYLPVTQQLGRREILLLALVGFAWNANDFPPMPWHTVDGVFWGVLGIYLIAHRQWPLLGGLALSLAAVAKQSYYPLPVLGLVVAMASGGKAGVKCLLGVLLGAAAWTVWLVAEDAWLPFLQSTTSAASGMDVLLSLQTYLTPKTLIACAAALVLAWALRRWLLPEASVASLLAALTVSGLVLLSFHELAIAGRKIWGGYTNTLYVACGLTWLLVTARALANGTQAGALLREQLPALALFGLGVLSSLSWGYRTAAMMTAPALLYLLWQASRIPAVARLPREPMLLGVLAVSLGYFLLANNYPYLSRPRKELSFDLGELAPRLAHTKADRRVYDKLADFTRLTRKYPSFVVVPEFPGAYFVAETMNPTPVDWVFNGEMTTGLENFYQLVSATDSVFFLELSPDYPVTEQGRFDSPAYRQLMAIGCGIETTAHFKVVRVALDGQNRLICRANAGTQAE
ncbi:MAG: hypothetical protein ACRETN_04910 [Nevskiales bacterium]